MTVAAPQSYSDLLHEVQPRPIHGKVDYRRQLEWLDRLMSIPPTRHTSMMIEMLSLTLGAFEAQQFPIRPASPEAVLHHLIENSERTATSIARDLGISPATLSNYRTGRRKLTLASVVQLAHYFGVNPNVFLAAPAEPTPAKRRRRPRVRRPT